MARPRTGRGILVLRHPAQYVLAAFVSIGSALAVFAVGRVYFELLLDQWNSFMFWLENLFS